MAFGVSADGRLIAVNKTLPTGQDRAFKYSDATGMVDLGTLGGNHAYAHAISADGSVVVGKAATPASAHAFKHSDATGMIDLGTLGGASSSANGVSADGAVVVGDSLNLQGRTRAFKHTEATGMIDLGTLKADNSGDSLATAVSGDGSVVVGQSDIDTDSNVQHAFKYTDANGMTDLGTLGGTSSQALGISADGQVVVGSSETITGGTQAFKHTDANGMVELGSWGGDSSASAASADGRVVVGFAITAEGDNHAFRHTDADGMIDLGTLGGQHSAATAVSADGNIAVGLSLTASGDLHAALWKITETGTHLLDLDNTRSAMAKSANRAWGVLDLRSAQLDRLMSQECQIDSGSFCIGVGPSYSRNRETRQTSTSLTLGARPSDHLRVGITLDQNLDQQLPDNYTKAGSNAPAVAMFVAMDESGQGLGWQGRLAAAYLSSKVDIRREQLAYTDAGQGRSSLRGKAFSIEGGYGLRLDSLTVTPYIGLSQTQVSRQGYSEHSGAVMAASYAKMQRSVTRLNAGVRTAKRLTKQLELNASLGLIQDLDKDQDAFQARMDYLGRYTYQADKQHDTRFAAGTGASYALNENSAVHAGVFWTQEPGGNDTTGIQTAFTYQF
ncbi:outer membrane autotransporter barrel domain-containing protein [Pseudomonas sp. Os17]|uniref:autotransporter domain-containing protein n=1 Tax=Pseudomonas sp. Os17 TaxID=1500686 RepID=UPI0005FCC088|nr:autotransporter outer membrane beta-barrel domain-containing protein [Pseudomonas sp. Os17]BAQ75017.1 outer membrane autotransporter barrel domain-containing protein [Pseudomonas sp. Os17]